MSLGDTQRQLCYVLTFWNTAQWQFHVLEFKCHSLSHAQALVCAHLPTECVITRHALRGRDQGKELEGFGRSDTYSRECSTYSAFVYIKRESAR